MNWNETFTDRPLQSVLLFVRNDKLIRNGVAVILRQDVAQAVRGHAARFDWITSNRLIGNPINIPILKSIEDEVENFYASIQEETDHIPKHDILIIIGDWNTIVGNKKNQMSSEIWTRGWE